MHFFGGSGMQQFHILHCLKRFFQRNTLQYFKPLFCVAHVGHIESVVARIFQSGELHLKKFRNAVLIDAPVLRAEVEVSLVPLGEDLHDVIELRFFGWKQNEGWL
jgi:hypothetical protein